MADNNDGVINLDDVRQAASESISKSASYEKKRFDSNKAGESRFSGEFVLIANEESNQTRLDPKYRGPFKIVEVLDGDRYLFRPLINKRTYKYAHDRVRKMPEGRIPIEIVEDEVLD